MPSMSAMKVDRLHASMGHDKHKIMRFDVLCISPGKATAANAKVRVSGPSHKSVDASH